MYKRQGQSFDRLVDFDTRDGKGSVVIEGVEQTYTLNTADNTCSVSGGKGNYKVESCATRSRGDIVMLCPTANDIPVAFLQRKDAAYLKPSSYAELRQVAVDRSSAGGVALNLAFCTDSLITIDNRIIVRPDGTLTLTVDGDSDTANTIETGQIFSPGGYSDTDARGAMKVYKWLPEVATGAKQTVRYIVMFTGTPLVSDPEFPVFPPMMYVTPATLELPAS